MIAAHAAPVDVVGLTVEVAWATSPWSAVEVCGLDGRRRAVSSSSVILTMRTNRAEMKFVVWPLIAWSVLGRRCLASWAEEGERYDADAVASAVGVLAGGENDRVEELVAEAIA